MRAARGVSLGILCLVLAASPTNGQTTTASIMGTVHDQSGAVLPGVSVAVKSLETGASREVMTDDSGHYAAPQLPLGDYQVEASLAGFQTEVRTGIRLTIGREAVVDFSLAVGEISERVQVTGDAPIIETTSSTIAGLVDDKKIRDLPLNGRSFSDLVTLQVGAVTQTLGARSSGSGFGLKISVAGARPSENSFLLDGNFVNDTLNNTPAGVTGLFLGVETLREFTVLTNTFSAEYGQSAGAVVNAVTKSGTNDFHGATFYFHRNSALDARNFFDRERVPPFRRHQYGGILGGPLVRNKTFFFFGYEALREGLGVTQIIDTLTADARQGIIPDATQPGGVRRVTVGPGIADYFILYPLPNGRAKAAGAAEHLYARNNQSLQDNVVGKIDHVLSESDSLFVRYTFDDADVSRPSLNFATVLHSRNQYVTIEEKKVFSSRWLNIARVGFNRSVISDNERPLIDLPERLQLVPTGRNAIPDIARGQLGNFGVTGLTSIGNGSAVPRIYHLNLFEYSDTLSYLRGAHSIKFGANIKRVQANMISPQRLFGSITFNSIVDFLQGNAGIYQFVKPGSDVIRGQRFTVYGFFVQDDVRIRPNLTLNIGLRYEPSTIHREVNGKVSNLRDPRRDAALTVGDPFFENPTMRNFAPRVGLAWDPFGNGKTSIRAGFGLFYNIQMADIDRITTTSNPPFATVLAFNNFRFPFDFEAVLRGANEPRPALESIDFRPGQPYRIQYNLNIQRELMPGTSFTVGYVGARGVDLFRIYNANQPDPIPSPNPARPTPYYFPPGLSLLNPNFNVILQRSTGADAYYSSMQLSLNRRFSSGFQAQASYTFGKSIDTSSKSIRTQAESSNTSVMMNPLDPRADRSYSEFDVKHTLSVNYTVELPGKGLTGLAGGTLGGWQLGGIVTVATGVPFNILAGYDSCRCLQGSQAGAGGTDNRPDLIAGGNSNPVLGGPDHYYDELQFQPAPDGYYGNLARNSLRLAGVRTVDFSLTKRTAIREGAEVQFRAEMFNLFNHANFGAPSNLLFQRNAAGVITRRAGLGRITSTLTTSRQIQFGLKILF